MYDAYMAVVLVFFFSVASSSQNVDETTLNVRVMKSSSINNTTATINERNETKRKKNVFWKRPIQQKMHGLKVGDSVGL